MSKFKIGDKVVQKNGNQWCSYLGEIPRYRTVVGFRGQGCYMTFGESENSERSEISWYDNELELYIVKKRILKKEEEVKMSNNSKFKIGDKVSRADGRKWLLNDNTSSDYRTIRKIDESSTLFIYALSKTKDGQEHYGTAWGDKDIKLYVEPKKVEDKPRELELSYIDTINYLMKDGEEGETWVSSKLGKNSKGLTQHIRLVNGVVEVEFKKPVKGLYLIVNGVSRFKRKEDSKTVRTICKVEHSESGKRYDFRTDLLVFNESMVVCETKFGKSYGKVVSFEDINMTDSEYNEYSKIIKVI